MLLPECARGVKRGNDVRVVLAPATLPYICPSLGCFSSVHTATVRTGTGRFDAKSERITRSPFTARSWPPGDQSPSVIIQAGQAVRLPAQIQGSGSFYLIFYPWRQRSGVKVSHGGLMRMGE
jgi:hypothetical protein